MQNEEHIPGIDDEPTPLVEDPLEALKDKCRLVGLTFHPNIGLDTLRERYEAHIANVGAPKSDAPAAPAAVEPAPVVEQAAEAAPAKAELKVKTMSPKAHADHLSVGPENESAGARRVRKKRHALELIRIRVTCMDPKKKEWEGEIIASGNATAGTISKYVPFNNDEGWHVPRIIYKALRDRMAQIFVTVKNEKGQKVRTGKMIKEFAIEVLDPLTAEELEILKADQAARRAID